MRRFASLFFLTFLSANNIEVVPFDWGGQFGYLNQGGAIFWNSDWRSNNLLFDGTWTVYPRMFGPEIENGFNCNKCSSCIDTPKFIKPNRSDIDTIPEIFELEENYVPEASTQPLDESIVDQPKTEEPVVQDYRLLPDGYIDHPLASKLRTYAKEEASKRNIPPYGVFPKKVVNEIVIRRPKNFVELKEIPGLGDKKIEEFGEDILEMVKDEEE